MSGLYFEQFEVGQVIQHALQRTVTEADNVLFNSITMNPQPLHLDAEFANNTEFQQRVVNGLFTLGLMLGMTVGETTLRTTIANLGMTDVTFPSPLFHGDTVRSVTKVVSKRETRSRPDAGIVQFEHTAYNQRGAIVARCLRVALMKRQKSAV